MIRLIDLLKAVHLITPPPMVNELVTDTEVICDNCGWKWKIADGGVDLYICHNTLPSGDMCGYDNDPDLQKTKYK